MKAKKYKEFRVVEIECKNNLTLTNSSNQTHELVAGETYYLLQSLENENEFIIPIEPKDDTRGKIFELDKKTIFNAFNEKEFRKYLNDSGFGSFIPLFSAALTIACPRGCSDFFSAIAASLINSRSLTFP